MTFSIWTVALLAIMGLLGAGFYGLLISRNLIKVVVALQVMVKGAILAMVVAGRMNGSVMLGQTMALTVIVADTIVAVIGLALAVQVRRYCGTLDLQALSSLRR
jgi:NADH:ubiquinone oxidoreductase subunit K